MMARILFFTLYASSIPLLAIHTPEDSLVQSSQGLNLDQAVHYAYWPWACLGEPYRAGGIDDCEQYWPFLGSFYNYFRYPAHHSAAPNFWTSYNSNEYGWFDRRYPRERRNGYSRRFKTARSAKTAPANTLNQNFLYPNDFQWKPGGQPR